MTDRNKTPAAAPSPTEARGEIFLIERQLAERHQGSPKTLRNDRVRGSYVPSFESDGTSAIGYRTCSFTSRRSTDLDEFVRGLQRRLIISTRREHRRYRRASRRLLVNVPRTGRSRPPHRGLESSYGPGPGENCLGASPLAPLRACADIWVALNGEPSSDLGPIRFLLRASCRRRG
jgi:hypothetical protein